MFVFFPFCHWKVKWCFFYGTCFVFRLSSSSALTLSFSALALSFSSLRSLRRKCSLWHSSSWSRRLIRNSDMAWLLKDYVTLMNYFLWTRVSKTWCTFFCVWVFRSIFSRAVSTLTLSLWRSWIQARIPERMVLASLSQFWISRAKSAFFTWLVPLTNLKWFFKKNHI